MRQLPALLLILPALLQAAPGEIYHWTDAEGRVHFGDQPPPLTPPQTTVERLQHLERDPNAPPSPPVSIPSWRYEAPKRAKRSTSGESRRAKRKQRCREFNEKLDELRDKMRRGFTLSQEPALKKRERAYKDGIFENCR